jgi:hypothetical protein
VNSVTLSITYIGCHSVFIDDFKVYSYCVFADALWITIDIAFFTIPCLSHNSIFAIVLMRRSSIHLRCRFQTSVVSQFSVMISFSTEIQFSRTIYGSAVTLRFLQFHASDMILFFLSISCVGRELIDAVDYIHRQSLSIHWWFQGLQWLSFPRWFVNQQWHSVFDNSMRQPRLFFLSMMHRLSIHWRCRLYTSGVTHYSLKISRSTVTVFSPAIYGSAVT